MQQFTELERLVEPKLKSEFGEAEGGALWGGYTSARLKVLDDIAPFIAVEEKNLTDHSARHIKNVLQNAYRLLGEAACTGTDSQTALNANELYFLVLSILFHDLGNIFGRHDHNRKLEKAYSYARGSTSDLLPERRLLFSIVEAHCGQTREGSKDTIGALDGVASFKQKRLDCRRVAAILRLADELAEGPQRTSLFRQKHFPPGKDSVLYHDYANVVDPCIDRSAERIVLTYDIDVCPEGQQPPFNPEWLRQILSYCDKRSIKLDLERKYNSHYCSLLRPFKKTEISFHFHFQGKDLQLPYNKIVLDDLVLPTLTENSSLNSRPHVDFDIETIISGISSAVSEQTKAS
jgi:hypothetical protein